MSELPRWFLVRLGRYISTCARIERLVASSILLIADGSVLSENQLLRLTREGPADLLKMLADNQLSAPEIQQQIDYVRGRVEAFLDNRHMAAHGVWSFSDGQLSVSFRPRPYNKDDATARLQETQVALCEIDEAIDDALDIEERLKWIQSRLTHPS